MPLRLISGHAVMLSRLNPAAGTLRGLRRIHACSVNYRPPDPFLPGICRVGPAGETWTLASFSYAKGRLWMHTMKEVICIGTK